MTKIEFTPQRVGSIKPSATLEVARKAGEMVRAGIDIVRLNAGEPDFDTPACIVEHAREKLSEGWTHRYTAARGAPVLVEAVRAKFKRDQGLDVAEDEVLCTVGSKGSIALAVDAIVGPGDEVILFTPAWVSYEALILMAGGVPVMVPCDAANDYNPSAEDLRAAITDKTKLVLINSPCNPTGAAYDAALMKELMAVLEGTNILVLSDEVYERLVYDGFEHVSPAAVSEDARARTLVISGVAKGYAMTGWRVGFCAGPRPLIKAMHTIQGQRVTAPSSIAQAAAAFAISEPDEVKAEIAKMVAAYQSRRDQLIADLRAIEGVRVPNPRGAFYVFVDLSAYSPDDIAMSRALLEEAHVSVVPGTPFGKTGAVRISFATDAAALAEGVARIGAHFGK